MRIIERAVLEIAWTVERKETIIVGNEGIRDVFACKRDGSGDLNGRQLVTEG